MGKPTYRKLPNWHRNRQGHESLRPLSPLDKSDMEVDVVAQVAQGVPDKAPDSRGADNRERAGIFVLRAKHQDPRQAEDVIRV